MKTIEIPTNLNLEDLIIKKYPEFYSHLDKFYHIIHTIRMKWFSDCRYKKLNRTSKKARKKSFITLNNEVLIKLYGSNYYRKILDILIEEKIIEPNNQYEVGKYSKSYRLTEKYLDTEIKAYTIKEKKLEIRILKKEKEDYELLTDLNKQILEMMKTKFTFDINHAFKVSTQQKNTKIINENSFNHVFNQLTQLQNGNFYLSTSEKTGRIFHNYSNLKKDLRNFIKHISNEKLIEIDISNSQPFFLGCIVSQLEQTSDTKEFINIVEDGTFYDYLRKHICNDLEKEDVLTMFYCPSYWNIKHKEKFAELFPTVSKVIEMIKETDYRNLAIELQSRESEMILKIISPILLVEKIDFIPIHDSFLIKETDTNRVKEIIERCFIEKYKMFPLLKIKSE